MDQLINEGRLSMQEALIDRRSFLPVPETHGVLSHILVNARSTDSPNLYAEMDLIRQLSAHTPHAKITVSTDPSKKVWGVAFEGHNSQAEIVREMLQERGVVDAVVFERTVDQEGIWARDLGIWADEGKVFVIPGIPFTRGHFAGRHNPVSERMQKRLSHNIGADVIVTDLSFDGGDCLVSSDSAFFGSSVFERDVSGLQRAQERFRLPLTLIGKQMMSPFPHLDSGVVLLSDNSVLINDPDQMNQVLCEMGKADWEEWLHTIGQWYQGKERALASGRSQAQTETDLIRDIQNFNQPGTHGYDLYQRSLERERRMYAEIYTQFEQLGIKLVKIPGLDLGFPLSVTNSIADEMNGKRRLFIGQFGSTKIDSWTNDAIASSHEVDQLIPTGLAFPLMQASGGNRCVANILRK